MIVGSHLDCVPGRRLARRLPGLLAAAEVSPITRAAGAAAARSRWSTGPTRRARASGTRCWDPAPRAGCSTSRRRAVEPTVGCRRRSRRTASAWRTCRARASSCATRVRLRRAAHRAGPRARRGERPSAAASTAASACGAPRSSSPAAQATPAPRRWRCGATRCRPRRRSCATSARTRSRRARWRRSDAAHRARHADGDPGAREISTLDLRHRELEALEASAARERRSARRPPSAAPSTRARCGRSTRCASTPTSSARATPPRRRAAHLRPAARRRRGRPRRHPDGDDLRPHARRRLPLARGGRARGGPRRRDRRLRRAGRRARHLARRLPAAARVDYGRVVHARGPLAEVEATERPVVEDAPAPVPGDLPSRILALQRTSGNRAVTRLLARATWGKEYGRTADARQGQSFEKYKSQIGSESFATALKSASAWGKHTKPVRVWLTIDELEAIIRSENPSPQAKEENHKRLVTYLPILNNAFATMGIDTVEAQASFLSHAGESGSFAKLEEELVVGQEYPYPAAFKGRGPVQVTFEAGYVQSLAYLELRADQLEEEAKTKSEPEKSLLLDQAGKARAAVAAIQADSSAAAKAEYGFLLSAAYMHWTKGVKRSTELHGSAERAVRRRRRGRRVGHGLDRELPDRDRPGPAAPEASRTAPRGGEGAAGGGDGGRRQEEGASRHQEGAAGHPAPDRHQARHPASDRPREGQEGDLRACVEDARRSQPRPQPSGGDRVRRGVPHRRSSPHRRRSRPPLPPLSAPAAPAATKAPSRLRVDVHVITTSSGPGDDEVYVLASGAGGDHKTPVRGMGNGERHTFELPAKIAGDGTRPISIKVFDEDWPSSDDLLVWLNWSPPFASDPEQEVLRGFQLRGHAERLARSAPWRAVPLLLSGERHLGAEAAQGSMSAGSTGARGDAASCRVNWSGAPASRRARRADSAAAASVRTAAARPGPASPSARGRRRAPRRASARARCGRRAAGAAARSRAACRASSGSVTSPLQTAAIQRACSSSSGKYGPCARNWPMTPRPGRSGWKSAGRARDPVRARPGRPAQVRDVDVVAGRADDRLDALRSSRR